MKEKFLLLRDHLFSAAVLAEELAREEVKSELVPEILAQGAAAAYIGVSSTTLQKMADKNLIPCIRATENGFRKFRKADLDLYLGRKK